jgi:hypothetical protein
MSDAEDKAGLFIILDAGLCYCTRGSNISRSFPG